MREHGPKRAAWAHGVPARMGLDMQSAWCGPTFLTLRICTGMHPVAHRLRTLAAQDHKRSPRAAAARRAAYLVLVERAKTLLTHIFVLHLPPTGHLNFVFLDSGIL